MNTKGIKFLAVLGVMVMAFAAIITLAPADLNATSVDISTFDDAQIDPKVISYEMTTGTGHYTEFYFSDDATVKITGLDDNITIYVQNGKEVELDIKFDSTHQTTSESKTITVYSVTSDLQRLTTSTVDTTSQGSHEGKVRIDDTVFTFNGVKGQTVIYEAMMPGSVKTVTTSSPAIASTSTIKTTTSSGTQKYATISSDMKLTNPTIGSKVTIAAGQYLEVASDSNVNVAYGIKFADATSGASNFYYAKGANAGTIDLDSGDIVTVVDGTVSMKNGTATVKASSVTGANLTFTNAASNRIDMAGTVTYGTVTASGAVKFAAVTVGTAGYGGGSIIVSNNTAIETGSSVAVYGELVLKTDKAAILNLTVSGTGTIVAQNPKLWTYSNTGAASLEFAVKTAFYGLFDVTAINETARVVDRFSTAEIAVNQTFEVVGNTNVSTSLTVYGVLIINEGVTLTISKTQDIGAALTLSGQYAQIINNGTINIKTTASATQRASESIKVGLQVEGGLFVNNGTISGGSDSYAAEKATLGVNINNTTTTNGGLGFFNAGTITLPKNDCVAFTKGVNNYGTFNINSSFKSAAIIDKNAGTFVLTNAEIGGTLTVNTVAGGEVKVNAAVLDANESIIVQHGNSNSITIAVPGTGEHPFGTDDYATVRGLTVTDKTTLSGTVKLDLSGSMGVTKTAATPSTTLDDLTVTLTGTGVQVSESLLTSSGFKLAGTSTVTVSGDWTIATGVTGSGSNYSLVVSGKITDSSGVLSGAKFAAAKYVLGSSNTTIFSSFETAVSSAVEANVNSIDVGVILKEGKPSKYVTITKDIVIPEGMIVTGNYIAVGDKDNAPTVLLEPTSLFSFTTVDLIDGMIATTDANVINEASVRADVKEIDDLNNTAVYKSLGVAILLSQPGDVIYLAQDVQVTDDLLVIPEGVTVSGVTEDGNKLLSLVNSDMIVNGTLMVDDFMFIATIDDTKSITLNGTIIDIDESGDSIKDWWFTPVGVSYNLTVEDEYGNESTWYVITNIAYLQDAIDVADDSKVTIEGDAVLGTVTITGTEDQPAEVTFNGDVTAENLILNDAIIIAKNGNEINATFSNALGYITISGAYVKSTTMSIYSLDDGIVTMTGAISDDVTGTYLIEFGGLTGMDNATIGWGYNSEYGVPPSINFEGITTATGKKNFIQQYDDATGFVPTQTAPPTATINGSLIADNDSKVTFDKVIVEVVGGLVAAEKTATENLGTIEVVNGWIFVGMTADDIYDFDAVLPDTGDEGVLSGKFVLGTNVRIYAAPDATIEDSIIEDLFTMPIFVDDELWFNVIAEKNHYFSLDYLEVPMFNAAVDKIVDSNDREIAHTMVGKVINQTGTINTISGYGAIYIGLDYYIFEVKIKTDGSVKAVYIDGVLMETGNVANIFTMKSVAAGPHKVTVEAATGYDADKCVLYTEMGTILPGMAFNFTEYDVTEYDVEVIGEQINKIPVVVYNINGTEIQPEPVPPTPEEESQWTVTTILLVILVVLIAIMAVIVALRLNRS